MFDKFYRGSEPAPHLNRVTGERIEDPAYFGPTHKRLLKKGPSWIQPVTTVSAEIDRAVHAALWEAQVFKEKRKSKVLLVVARGDTPRKKHYMRVTTDNSGHLIMSHTCPDCSVGTAGCHHVMLAVCAFESVVGGPSGIPSLVKQVQEACEPDSVYTGEAERRYLCLCDELYYFTRYTLTNNQMCTIEKTPAPKKYFDTFHGARVQVGDAKGQPRVVTGQVRVKREPKPDWKRYRVERELTDGEKAIVPADVYYVDSAGEELFATEAAFQRDPLLIVGPAGIGKSRLARRVFEHLGLPLMVVSASSDRDLYSLVAGVGLKGGETVEIPGSILTAARSGYGLLIDEIASLKPDRAMFLNSVLQERELDLGTETVKLHKDCRIVATCNEGDEFIGSFGLDPSTLDRFVPLYLDYLKPRAEAEVVARESGNEDQLMVSKMVDIAAKTRRLYKHGEMSKPITTRDLVRWAKYSKSGSPVKVARMTIVPAAAKDDEEKLALQDMIEEALV